MGGFSLSSRFLAVACGKSRVLRCCLPVWNDTACCRLCRLGRRRVSGLRTGMRGPPACVFTNVQDQSLIEVCSHPAAVDKRPLVDWSGLAIEERPVRRVNWLRALSGFPGQFSRKHRRALASRRRRGRQTPVAAVQILEPCTLLAALNPLPLSSLDGSTGFRMDGAVTGDVNGDNFDDLIIGASYADQNGASSGSSYVVFGQSEGFASVIDLSTLDGTTGFRLDGAQTLNATLGAGVDILIGGRGDDLLISDGGDGVLRGSEGDDVLAIPDVNISPRRLEGGTGTDTLRSTAPSTRSTFPRCRSASNGTSSTRPTQSRSTSSHWRRPSPTRRSMRPLRTRTDPASVRRSSVGTSAVSRFPTGATRPRSGPARSQRPSADRSRRLMRSSFTFSAETSTGT